VLDVKASGLGDRERPAGYTVPAISSATKTPTPLRDVPQAVTAVTKELIKDQMMMSVGDVMRYVPGIGVHQGENNRDQVIIRGNSSSADFFVDGVRDDVQYYRDLYNVDRVEALKGPNAMIFGRGGGGGVVNRVFKEALFMPHYEVSVQGGEYGNKRLTTDLDHP
jgi:catecholate siderophore receptor